MMTRRFLFGVLVCCLAISMARADESAGTKRLLYVAVPGVRNYLEYGGHGVLVYDIDEDYKLLRRMATKGLDKDGKPWNVKGVCASAASGRLYISTPGTLQCIDLV